MATQKTERKPSKLTLADISIHGTNKTGKVDYRGAFWFLTGFCFQKEVGSLAKKNLEEYGIRFQRSKK